MIHGASWGPSAVSRQRSPLQNAFGRCVCAPRGACDCLVDESRVRATPASVEARKKTGIVARYGVSQGKWRVVTRVYHRIRTLHRNGDVCLIKRGLFVPPPSLRRGGVRGRASKRTNERPNERSNGRRARKSENDKGEKSNEARRLLAAPRRRLCRGREIRSTGLSDVPRTNEICQCLVVTIGFCSRKSSR